MVSTKHYEQLKVGLPNAAPACTMPDGQSRPSGRHLRLVWSADRPTEASAQARGPSPSLALHQGLACRLLRPAAGPTSSAPRLRERWVLEFEPARRQEADRLIGWIGGADPQEQVRLEFPTRE